MTPGDDRAPGADTPEAIEARMRATRAALGADLDRAAHALRERTRHWPLWLVGSVAAAGLALGLARGRPPAAAQAPASVAPRAATGPALVALAGWAMRVAPLVRGVLRQFRQARDGRG